jgi:hypothetical protein
MWHAYGNAHSYADGNCHIHPDGDCDGNSDSDIYCNRYSNCYGHSDSNGNRIAAAYTDATASADTAAPTVRLVDQ